jgi:hypothetical protein
MTCVAAGPIVEMPSAEGSACVSMYPVNHFCESMVEKGLVWPGVPVLADAGWAALRMLVQVPHS